MKKNILLLIGFIGILFISVLSNYGSSVYNAQIETDLEYDVDVGDQFVYEFDFKDTQIYFDETEIDEEYGYYLYEIINNTIFNSGDEVNLTYQSSLFDMTYDFDTDLIDNSSYWSSPYEHDNIINVSLNTLVFEYVYIFPKDIDLDVLISKDMVDVFIYFFTGFEDRDDLKDNIETVMPFEEINIEDSYHEDVDNPYGKIEYVIDVDGENSSTPTQLDASFIFNFEIKQNKYGVIEDCYIRIGQIIEVLNYQTNELIMDVSTFEEMEYHIVWASEDKYITEDFIPYWNEQDTPNWFELNWEWIVGICISIPLVGIISYYWYSKANCKNLKDPTKNRFCRREK